MDQTANFREGYLRQPLSLNQVIRQIVLSGCVLGYGPPGEARPEQPSPDAKSRHFTLLHSQAHERRTSKNTVEHSWLFDRPAVCRIELLVWAICVICSRVFLKHFDELCVLSLQKTTYQLTIHAILPQYEVFRGRRNLALAEPGRSYRETL